MAGKAGRSGTNKGKDKPWADALRMAVNSSVGGHKRLRRIAEQCVSLAETGDIAAIKEIGDRLDGRPAQTAQIQGDMSVTVRWADERS